MRSTSKARLFLIELVIIILFFAIAGAVCANIFVKAHLTSEKSLDLTSAALKAQFAAECVKHAKDDEIRLSELLGADRENGGEFTVYYDESWNASAKDAARYSLSVSLSKTGGMLRAEISVCKGAQELYAIETGEYLGD